MFYHLVMLNVFQHPSLIRTVALVARWTLKRVQGDEVEMTLRSTHP